MKVQPQCGAGYHLTRCLHAAGVSIHNTNNTSVSSFLSPSTYPFIAPYIPLTAFLARAGPALSPQAANSLLRPRPLLSRTDSPTPPTMASSGRPKPSRKASSNHRSTLSLQKTEIRINVYDLLPVGLTARHQRTSQQWTIDIAPRSLVKSRPCYGP